MQHLKPHVFKNVFKNKHRILEQLLIKEHSLTNVEQWKSVAFCPRTTIDIDRETKTNLSPCRSCTQTVLDGDFYFCLLASMSRHSPQSAL